MAITTRMPARPSVNCTSSMASRIDTERSLRTRISTPLGSSTWIAGSMAFANTVEVVDRVKAMQLDLDRRQHGLHPIDHLHGVGVGLAVDREDDGTRAVEPARHLVVLDAVDRCGDVGNTHRCAVLPAHDH